MCEEIQEYPHYFPFLVNMFYIQTGLTVSKLCAGLVQPLADAHPYHTPWHSGVGQITDGFIPGVVSTLLLSSIQEFLKVKNNICKNFSRKLLIIYQHKYTNTISILGGVFTDQLFYQSVMHICNIKVPFTNCDSAPLLLTLYSLLRLA